MAVTAKGTPYVESSDLVANYPGASLALANHIDTIGKVLQVVSVLKQDTFSTSSTSYTDVTGLSVSITPSSVSSTILVVVNLALVNSTLNRSTRGAIIRGSTIIGGGTPAGNRPAGSFFFRSASGDNSWSPNAMTVLDSPATVSALTYKIQVATESGGSARVNQSKMDDSDNEVNPRLASSITVMEIT